MPRVRRSALIKQRRTGPYPVKNEERSPTPPRIKHELQSQSHIKRESRSESCIKREPRSTRSASAEPHNLALQRAEEDFNRAMERAEELRNEVKRIKSEIKSEREASPRLNVRAIPRITPRTHTQRIRDWIPEPSENEVRQEDVYSGNIKREKSVSEEVIGEEQPGFRCTNEQEYEAPSNIKEEVSSEYEADESEPEVVMKYEAEESGHEVIIKDEEMSGDDEEQGIVREEHMSEYYEEKLQRDNKEEQITEHSENGFDATGSEDEEMTYHNDHGSEGIIKNENEPEAEHAIKEEEMSNHEDAENPLYFIKEEESSDHEAFTETHEDIDPNIKRESPFDANAEALTHVQAAFRTHQQSDVNSPALDEAFGRLIEEWRRTYGTQNHSVFRPVNIAIKREPQSTTPVLQIDNTPPPTSSESGRGVKREPSSCCSRGSVSRPRRSATRVKREPSSSRGIVTAERRSPKVKREPSW